MDLVPAFLCFFVCILYELEFGILAGVAIQVKIPKTFFPRQSLKKFTFRVKLSDSIFFF